MKYAIISDIHSNIQALEQVLKDVKKNVDQIICLGDIVGYNANPEECINVIKDNSMVTHIVQGNHDEDSAYFEKMRLSGSVKLSPDAYDGMKYSSSVISDANRKWLKRLPEIKLVEDSDMPFWVSHYSPLKSTYQGYILCQEEGMAAVKGMEKIGKSKLYFFGHSHVPTHIEDRSFYVDGRFHFDMGRHLENDTYVINPNTYTMINPGAVGQPRSGITSYSILDTKEKTVKIQGFQYNIQDAQKAIREAGYSKDIANRLDPDHDKKVKQIKKEKYKARQKRIDAQGE